MFFFSENDTHNYFNLDTIMLKITTEYTKIIVNWKILLVTTTEKIQPISLSHNITDIFTLPA